MFLFNVNYNPLIFFLLDTIVPRLYGHTVFYIDLLANFPFQLLLKISCAFQYLPVSLCVSLSVT